MMMMMMTMVMMMVMMMMHPDQLLEVPLACGQAR